ncbi:MULTISPECIES: tRNA (cytidine(34)-2'-O)-methyltransferase [unclassified Oleiphilus]|uniref:tRNA (cytidine(34)-2'-O)-methyltransferase n=1 Tax=unclassified Oleiphilus TaxID=2631174 RepID=UPI0007C22C42|nr:MULTISPECIES: tRNA (cytidine(34)-2'-O)-methyltransferase [unclassified Oleiphilus]KZY45689.1 tRNA (cytosine(34)-2'-O)-methyltransferase TrmL [Oleiphilus sp. HI0050]KZY76960.1 tRNA (cytosine(34)-2'-O)-methyltransferase TrmL [Oleiphilus sp. HI0068]KZY80737.1 tRNA (cytosine(34)-2'-O)-methyltransferase TrmL [Oleiphilus sp. HI0069]KZY88379.1 tRNA (cytosine(34)-2'-O)-methyltransferase TrmL [Oleiphilus sp. HI0072]KZZ10052.1 tRNA (cytosine(34)-2'-O)-methyltransferase TrmL [Oleiphilus sp. HI0078]KZ
MFHIALYEPQIAPNTGNIIRLVANNGCYLHLIEPLGFDLEEKKLRRAGLDYRDMANVTRHKDYASFLEAVEGRRIIACTTKGSGPHDQLTYQEGDVLLFGSETAGLPDSVLASIQSEHRIRIPMMVDSRSLNLSNAVAIISYEAWRQCGFKNAQLVGEFSPS